MSEYTKEPWCNHGVIIKANDNIPAQATSEANASRIVACVNACAGIPTEQLEGIKENSLLQAAARAMNIDLLRQRDELLEILEGLSDDIEALIEESHGVAGLHLNGDVAPWGELQAGGRFERFMNLPIARAVIASAKGGAA